MVKFYYKEKQATYTSIFLMSLFPGVVNEKYYFVTPIILSGMIIASVSVLVHVICKDCAGIKNKYMTGTVNMLLIFVILQTLLVPLEAIYWYNGGTHYVCMQSMLFFEIAVIIHILNSDSKKTRIWMTVLACFLGFMVGGGNLISGLQGCILGALCIILFLIQKAADKKDNKLAKLINAGKYDKANWIVAIPIAVTYIAYAANALAPCNSLRAEVEVQMNPIKAVINSFYWGATYIFTWVSPMSVILFVIIAVVVWKQLEGTNKTYMNPWVMALLSYCVFAAMLTPTFYAMSTTPPNRVINILGIARYVFVFINIVNDCGYLRSTGKESGLFGSVLSQTEKNYKGIIIVGGLLIGLLFVLAIDKNTYTSMSAVRSIISGEASRYYDQSMARFEIYNDQSQADVVVNHLTDDAKPYLLYKEDIDDEPGEPGYWQNVEICDYYGKNSITVAD